MTRLGKISKCRKTAKVEGYNTRFRTFSVSELRSRVMPPRDVGGNCKAVTWLGMNIWKPLRSFREILGLKRNKQIGSLEAF